jgi:hypothetical protein
MLLASAVLAGSLLVTGAQARGGGGGGGGHMGGGFGGGHVGGFGGSHVGVLGAGVAGGAGLMAHATHEHFGAGGRRFVGGDIYDGGLGCPYDTSYTPPYPCVY